MSRRRTKAADDARATALGSAARTGEEPMAADEGESLRRRTWPRFLRAPDSRLLDELYVPGLAAAVRYDRCCAYFSSSVLSAAARGFGRLIERLVAMRTEAPRPAVRLIVNEELAAEDVRAMMETGDTSALERALLKRFKRPKDLLETQRLKMLGWMVKHGLLEMRVGVMRQGTGLVHAKFGLMFDRQNDAIVFSGSGNESAPALIANYERLELSTSWDDWPRYEEYAAEFEALWRDEDADVHTVPLPEAVRLKLIRLAPRQPPIDEPGGAIERQKAAMRWRFIVEAPYLADLGGGRACDATAMVELWPHQRRVVEETADAWPDGRLLCDEVGMGKTLEAICVLRRLLAGRGAKRVLLLAPRGLLEQWQGELREKGGLIVPRLEGRDWLIWPDGTKERTELPCALKRTILLMSRETARTPANLARLLAAEPWDLVLVDEAHAARRAKQEEGEFNHGNLLLEMLRKLQLRGKARGLLLLSATPMQTHPWEPWDLLAVLGEGGEWLSEFQVVRRFYDVILELEKPDGFIERKSAKRVARLIAEDPEFPPPPDGCETWRASVDALADRLVFASGADRVELARWLRRGSPLRRRMHRNTRRTLQRYYERGLLEHPPPRRVLPDKGRFDFSDEREREAYQAITRYINRRFEELETEQRGKGFVMTVYRRRATSSWAALRRSLERRRDGLERIVKRSVSSPALEHQDEPERLDLDELPDSPVSDSIEAGWPTQPEAAQSELDEVNDLLGRLEALGTVDSKRDIFFSLLHEAAADGCPVLVFTEFVDTMEYLADALKDSPGHRLGTYSGQGGRVWSGNGWRHVTKDAVARALQAGEVSILICTDAASEGLNLQAAGALINYDLPWNPSRVEQRIGRIDRIGQRSLTITIVNLFLRDSVDDRVYRVLRSRCRLFENFVGAMQPVLARASRLLIGAGSPDLAELQQAAIEVERDVVAKEVFAEQEADDRGDDAPPALTRRELQGALLDLNGVMGVRVVREQEDVLRITAPGRGRRCFGLSVEALEADDARRPVSPSDEWLLEIEQSLQRAGERLPLVVAAYSDGPFRAVVAVWVGQGDPQPVRTFSELGRLVDEWDGECPAPEVWRRASDAALAQARRRVAGARERAEARAQQTLRRQRDGAKHRLMRELGRYLVSLDGAALDLNRVFYHSMQRDIAGAERLRRCLAVFDNGYPPWPDDLRDELAEFGQGLGPGARQARIMGSELDAALSDPRLA